MKKLAAATLVALTLSTGCATLAMDHMTAGMEHETRDNVMMCALPFTILIDLVLSPLEIAWLCAG